MHTARIVILVSSIVGAFACSAAPRHHEQPEPESWWLGQVPAPLAAGETACVSAGAVPVAVVAADLDQPADGLFIEAAADGAIYVFTEPSWRTTDVGCVARHDLRTGVTSAVDLVGYWEGAALAAVRGRLVYPTGSLEAYQTDLARDHGHGIVDRTLSIHDPVTRATTALPNSPSVAYSDPIHCRVADDSVFWKNTTEKGENFGRWDLASGKIAIIGNTLKTPTGASNYAVAGGEIFYLRRNDLEAISVDGGEPRIVTTLPGDWSLPRRIVGADAQSVYLAMMDDQGDMLVAFARDGSSTRIVTRDIFAVSAFDTDFVYHSSASGTKVLATPKQGGDSIVLADAGFGGAITSIVTDACNVYWTTHGPDTLFARSHVGQERAAAVTPATVWPAAVCQGKQPHPPR